MVEREWDADKDWLDVWMGSMTEVEGSSEVRRCMVVEDDTMQIAILDEQDRDVDFMTWLVEELREMHVEDEVIDTISECVRTVSCPGDVRNYAE